MRFLMMEETFTCGERAAPYQGSRACRPYGPQGFCGASYLGLRSSDSLPPRLYGSMRGGARKPRKLAIAAGSIPHALARLLH
jgi:hypothetical protein